AAHGEGLGYPELGDQAEPYDSTPVQPADPQLAWTDAQAAVHLLLPGQKLSFKVPPEWPILVNQQEPAAALSFALGHFRQMERTIHPLLTSEPVALRQSPNTLLTVPALLSWADERKAAGNPDRLLAAAVLRLARYYGRAGELLDAVGAGWETVVQNERAA